MPKSKRANRRSRRAMEWPERQMRREQFSQEPLLPELAVGRPVELPREAWVNSSLRRGMPGLSYRKIGTLALIHLTKGDIRRASREFVYSRSHLDELVTQATQDSPGEIAVIRDTLEVDASPTKIADGTYRRYWLMARLATDAMLGSPEDPIDLVSEQSALRAAITHKTGRDRMLNVYLGALDAPSLGAAREGARYLDGVYPVVLPAGPVEVLSSQQ